MKYVCQYCGRECSNPGGLKTHEVQCIKNPNRKTYKCQYCGREFRNNAGLSNHEVQCIKNPNRGFRSKNIIMYLNMKDDEILNIFRSEYSHIKKVNNLKKINRALYNQLNERKLIYKVFTNRKKFEMHPEYKNMSDDEILNIFRSEYSHVKYQRELVKINSSLLTQLIKRNILNVAFPERRKMHPEYQNMSDDEILNIYHTAYSHVKYQHELTKINNSLVGQLIKRNLLDIVFPNRRIRHSKDSKLNLLTDLDLESMDWASILDLIGLGKLPKEFRKLAKFGANIPGRKQMMQDLIDTYNITPIEEAEKEITDEFEYDDDEEVIPDIDTEKENKRIGNTLGDYTEDLANDSKFKHLREKSVNRLWTKVLDDENYINEIYKKIENNSLTKFEKFIYEEFLDEYNEVENMEIH